MAKLVMKEYRDPVYTVELTEKEVVVTKVALSLLTTEKVKEETKELGCGEYQLEELYKVYKFFEDILQRKALW